jgi:CHAT domain-containing protein
MLVVCFVTAGLFAERGTVVAQQEPTRAEQQLVAEFAHAFETGLMATFGPLTATGAIDGGAWVSVRDVLERFHDVSVTTWRVMVDDGAGARRLRIDLEATGVAANATRERGSVPRIWYVTMATANGRLTIQSAATQEMVAARALLGSPDVGQRQVLLDQYPALDRRRFLEAVGDLAGAAARSDPSASGVEWGKARVALEFLRGQAQAARDTTSEAVILAALATGIMERREDARAWAESAVAVADKSGDADVQASAHFARGKVLLRNGDPKGLDDLWFAAHHIDRVDDPRVALKALLNIAQEQIAGGDLRSAVLVADRLSRESKQFGWREGEAMASWTMADVHNLLRRPELAAVYLRETYEGLSQVGNLSWAALALGELSTAEIAQGRIDDAMPLLERARALGRTRLPPYWHSMLLANPVPALLAHGRILEASRLVDESLAAAGSPDTIPYEAAVAGASLQLMLGHAELALSLATDQMRYEKQPQWLTRALAGRALRMLGRPREAEDQLRRAIDLIEERRATIPANALDRVSFLADKLQPYRELVTVLVDQQRTDEAFAVAERMKGQALQLSLEQGYVNLSSTMGAEEKERERGLDEAIAKLNRELLSAEGATATELRNERDEARRQLELFRSDLYLRHPVVAARRVPDGDPMRAALAALPPGGTALELTVLEQETIAFTVTRVNDRVVVQATRIPIARAALERDVIAFAEALGRRDPAADAMARVVSGHLIAPIAGQLRSLRQLTVVPDGILWRVPWEVLRAPGGRRLVERMAIARAPSLQFLARTRQSEADVSSHTGKQRLLALGDPRIAASTGERVRALQRGARLGRLPEAAREVRTIGRLYGAERSEVRIGARASETAFKRDAPRFDVLHLATHGVVDDRAPMFSALALAAGGKDGGDDGLLEAREIAELQLTARLVVLSACDTARGRLEAGEGVIGLSWAFLASGVPALVVSGWKTDSAATERLMVGFHRGLLAGLSPAEALRRSEVALLHDARYAHPYYWAPFAVVGDGR